MIRKQLSPVGCTSLPSQKVWWPKMKKSKLTREQVTTLSALLVADAVLLAAPSGSTVSQQSHEVKRSIMERFDETRHLLIDSLERG